MKNKMLFVGDGGQSLILNNLCAERNISIKYIINVASVKLSLVHRHFVYLRTAFKAVCLRRKFDYVFIWQQYIGIYYVLLSFFFPFFKRNTFVYYIIFNNSKFQIINFLKRYVMLLMIESSHISKVFFMSKSDYLYMLISDEKKTVLNSIFMLSPFIENNINTCICNKEYFFSGGSSNRDYVAIKKLAELMPEKRFKVACLPRVVASLFPVPNNLELCTNAYGEAFEALILGSKAVILPLVDPNVMSGQIVCLRSMQAGKPIFMTRNNFMVDWMSDVYDIKFISFYSKIEELTSLLASCDHSAFFSNGMEARKYFFEKFSEKNFYESILNEIEFSVTGKNYEQS